MKNPITLYDYEKISDDLCFLGPNVTLKFNVALAKKGENDIKTYFHKEYERPSSFIDTDRSVSIKRSFNYFLSIDIKTSFDSNIMIRTCDMIQMKLKLKESLKWFNGQVFRETHGHYTIVWDHKTITIGKFLGNKYLLLEPNIMETKAGDERPCVRMSFASGSYVDIDMDNYMSFVYIIDTIDMYGAALTMINYLPINAGKNHYVLDGDSMAPFDLNLSNQQITTSQEKKTDKIYPKESFFEKSIQTGGNVQHEAISANPQGGERGRKSKK